MSRFELFRAKLAGCLNSLTIWVNALFLSIMPFMDTMAAAARDNLPTITPYLTMDIVKGATIFIVVVNIALRFKTSTGLENK